MESIKIFFSDKSYIELFEGDIIIPITTVKKTEETFATMDKPKKLFTHVSHGLIPSMLDILCCYKFFCLKGNEKLIYSVSSIVKIECV